VILSSAFLVLVGSCLSLYVAYWCLLLVTHFLSPARAATGGPRTRTFAIVIPAHNEELLLPRLLASIREQDYPPDRFTTIVIADNCTDGTVEAARRFAGTVLERVDTEKRGKGYAIKWALDKIDLDKYDALLVVDADCFLSPNALGSLDGSMQAKQVIQCYSGVGNPDESWFTRLLDVSRTINNDIYSSAKQRLGLSTQLIGTGMCFSRRILRTFGWDAFTVGEDCEYYATLIRHGESVGFDWNAKVYHQESATLRQATSQRLRWSSGRFSVAWEYGFGLLWRGIAERNLNKFDAGLTLVLPNPSLGMNITLVCLGVALLTPPGIGGAMPAWFLLLTLAQFSVFVVGVFHTKNRVRKFLAIFIAPAFLAWKLAIDALSILGIGGRQWRRTERKL
jgi:cellulose synthase/poly-beta-1,6-N-acetylglucosamine synthase-like glycosyltransferase